MGSPFPCVAHVSLAGGYLVLPVIDLLALIHRMPLFQLRLPVLSISIRASSTPESSPISPLRSSRATPRYATVGVEPRRHRPSSAMHRNDRTETVKIRHDVAVKLNQTVSRHISKCIQVKTRRTMLMQQERKVLWTRKAPACLLTLL